MQDIQSSYKNLIEIDELIDENFRGSCILKVYQAYIGSSKSISLSVQEILAIEVERNLTLLMRVMKKVRKRRKRDSKPPIQWISEFLVKINNFCD